VDVNQATIRRLHEIETQSRRALAVRDPHERKIALESIKAEKNRLTARLRVACAGT
jgi:hypothetical protein